MSEERKYIETPKGKLYYDFYGFENHISAEQLQQGKVGKITGIGNSMTPILKSKQAVIVTPITDKIILEKGDIVLCKVKGNHYLHKIHSIRKVGDNYQYLIGNNHGHMNGWVNKDKIYGKVIYIIPIGK